MTEQQRSLGVNPDANVEISAGETGWEAFCHEDFCQREEGWMTYRQAQKWRTAHRKAHARGEVEASYTYRAAWDMANGCTCDWGGRETCPLHITAEDQRAWEATNV